jgi:hypothetical protein
MGALFSYEVEEAASSGCPAATTDSRTTTWSGDCSDGAHEWRGSASATGDSWEATDARLDDVTADGAWDFSSVGPYVSYLFDVSFSAPTRGYAGTWTWRSAATYTSSESDAVTFTSAGSFEVEGAGDVPDGGWCHDEYLVVAPDGTAWGWAEVQAAASFTVVFDGTTACAEGSLDGAPSGSVCAADLLP